MAEYIEKYDLLDWLADTLSCDGCTDIDCYACIEQQVKYAPAAGRAIEKRILYR